MPFKSTAQRAKFAELVKQGKISQKEFDKWESETSGHLPERVKAKPKKQKSLLRKRG